MYTIYRISFPNGKFYVGLTKDLQNRIRQHRYRGTKSSSSKRLAVNRAIAKYKIVFDIIEVVTSLCEAKAREIHHIEVLNTYINAVNSNGYNMTKGGDRYSDQHGPLISEKLSSKRSFLVFNKTSGDLVGEWSSRYKCAIDLNVRKTLIQQVLSGNKHSCRGYTMIYKDNYLGQDMVYSYSAWNKGTIVESAETKLKQALAKGARYFCAYRIGTNELVGTWLNQADCAAELSVNRKHITPCLKGKRRSSGGYTFRYSDCKCSKIP